MQFNRALSVIHAFLFAVAVLFTVPQAFAQTNDSTSSVNPSATQPAVETANKEDPASWRAVLDSIQQALSREGLSDPELEKLRAETFRIAQEAEAEADIKRRESELVQQRIDTLGPAPKEGEPPEPIATQEQRKLLNEEFAELDASLRLSRQTAVRAEQLNQQIGTFRHERFFRSISVRSRGIMHPEFWGEFFGGFSSFPRSLSLLISDSASVFWKSLSENYSKLIGLGILVPLVLLGFIRSRRWIQTMSGAIPEHSHNAPVEGFLFYLRNGVLPALLLGAVYGILVYLELLTKRLDALIAGIVLSIGFLLAFIALVRVIFAPHDPGRRIAHTSDLASGRIYRILGVGLCIAIGISILNSLAVVFVSPIEVKVGLSFLFALFISISCLRALYLYRADRKQMMEHGGSRIYSRFWQLLVLTLWLTSFAILIAVIAGYVAFAEFLSQQLVFGLVVILTAWLLLRFIDFVFLQIATSQMAEQDASEPAGAIASGSGQAAILGSGFLKLAVYVVAGILLMLPWGYRTSDFFQIFEYAFFGFEVGGLSISVSTILLAFGLFAIGYTVTVALRNWLNNKLLPTTTLDIGISNSISTVFSYVGIIIAAMLAISAAGFDLSNLAIVAGALSVGVGFGLQSIVNNFVSGLILLAERPIKAGDWVSTSGGDGYVKNISVRSTEIETFDRATIIVPNSNLITDTVTNWTHGNKMGRIIIPVGVGYDSDPDQVKEILLACADDHNLVLGRPAPVVYFMDFGASSLDFQLRCYLSDINYSVVVQSELRFAILKALRDAKIEIPFPQRDVNLKNPEALVKPPTKARRKPATRKK